MRIQRIFTKSLISDEYYQWTLDNLSTLFKLVDAVGRKWTVIGKLMGIYPGNV